MSESHHKQSARGCIAWFTGLSASGKTTIAMAVAAHLRERGLFVVVLDGDELRRTLSRDLGFSHADREENMRRISALAGEQAGTGAVVLVAAIAPYRDVREHLKKSAAVPWIDVFVDAPLSVCEQRDPKGLYLRARAGLIEGFTGIDDVYEAPERPDVHCLTAVESVNESCAKVMAALEILRA